MPQNVPVFSELLASAQSSAVHLELHDSYSVSNESEAFKAWLAGEPRNLDPESDYWKSWVDRVRAVTGQGVVMRRARIVSEPVSTYVKYEYIGTSVVIEAGERVRWLPRRRASDLALPGNDFWLIDGRAVYFNHFTGEGLSADPEYTEDAAVVALCATAFEAVWARAIPHADYAV